MAGQDLCDAEFNAIGGSACDAAAGESAGKFDFAANERIV